MSKVYIVIKEYDDKLAKRQPWYTIKKIILDLNSKSVDVEVIDSISKIPNDFSGSVIKVFSLKDIFKNHINRNYKLVYLITFPIYPFSKFLEIPLKTIIENWKDLKRIFMMSLVPSFKIRSSLTQADEIITISDRSDEYLKTINVRVTKYIPFIFDNWGGVSKLYNKKDSIKTIGYFGPPFTTRCFDDVIDFFIWLNKHGYEFKKKIITRIERDELSSIEDEYLSKIEDKNLNVISGFLDRETLAKELVEIDVLILPFKIVMSELPVVVLEALELNIPIITTDDGGIFEITKNINGVLNIDKLQPINYNKVLTFINSSHDVEFNELKNIIIENNKQPLEILCQN